MQKIKPCNHAYLSKKELQMQHAHHKWFSILSPMYPIPSLPQNPKYQNSKTTCNKDTPIPSDHKSSAEGNKTPKHHSPPVKLPLFPLSCPHLYAREIDYVTVQSNSASRINFPSLYFSLASKALSYFQPTVSLHCLHAMSRTMCRPVVMFRSLASPEVTFTTLLKR